MCACSLLEYACVCFRVLDCVSIYIMKWCNVCVCVWFSGGGDDGPSHIHRLRDEDDELLQFAIQQSLMEAGTEDQQVDLLHGYFPPNFVALCC